MQPKVAVYTTEGKQAGEKNLNPSIFAVPVSAGILHQVVVGHASNRRHPIASTKGRGEVRGGGRKPWRQKGTGRARHGSIRSPLWRKGGVTFGPTSQRVFEHKLNKKLKDKAFRMALTDKVQSDALFLLENLKLKNEKTKEMVGVLKNLRLAKNETLVSTLVVLSGNEAKFVRLIRNIEHVGVTRLENLNTYDLVKHRNLLLTVSGLEALEDKLQPHATS